jgi:uncharacterized protein YjdB
MTAAPRPRWRPASRRLASGLLVLLACSEGGLGTIPVERVDLTPDAATLEVGRSATLAATPRDAAGGALAGRPVRWSTSDPLVATVADNGLVIARAPGTARIAASAGGQSATASVTVTARAVAALELAPVALALRLGRSAPLVARPLDAEGQLLTGRSVTFTSSDPRVATVTAQGVVTGAALGSAVVTARVDTRSAQAVITVSPEPVASVSVAPARDSLRIGDTRPFVATVRDADNRVLADRAVGWSTTDAAVATVSSSGVVTARAVGTVTISAVSEGRVGQAVVVVGPRAAEAITLAPDSATLAVGGELLLVAQVTAPDGTVLPGRRITFRSDAEAVARVDSTGRVRALSTGVARLTAESEGRRATATIVVVPPPVAEVRVQPAVDTLFTGQTRLLSALVRAADGTALTGRAVTWTTGAPLVASISAGGLVTAGAPGVAIVAATSEGVTGFASITVRARAVATVTVTPGAPSVAVNGTVQLLATARDELGQELAGRFVTWTTSDETVAFVSSTGLVVGVRTGVAVITATVEGVRGTTLVTVP